MEDRRNQIEAIRYRQGISQGELARRAGINVSTLSSIETGKVKPRAPTAFAIAQALGVPVDDLFLPSVSGGTPEESRPADGPTDGAPLSGEKPTSTPSGTQTPPAGLLTASSSPDRTADRAGVAKESDADLAGAR